MLTYQERILKMNDKKIEIYKRIRELRDRAEYMTLQDDLIDRFGVFPDEVSDLLTIGVIKMESEKALFETIRRVDDSVHLTLSPSGTQSLPAEEIMKALGDIPLQATMAIKKECLVVTLHLKNSEASYEWLGYIDKFITNIVAYRDMQKKQEPQTSEI